MTRAVGIIQAKDDIACVQQNQSTRINQAAYFAVWTIKPINISIFWVTKMTILTSILNPYFGVMLECNDVKEILDQNADDFRNLFYQSKIVVIRGANPTPEAMLAIGSKLGRLMDGADYARGRELAKTTELNGNTAWYGVFSNKISAVLGVGAMTWHADNPDREEKSFPIRAIRMVNCPNPEAGLTQFLDIDRGWDLLPDDLKNQWLAVSVEQHSWYEPGTGHERFPSMKVHPVTGKMIPRLNSVGRSGWISNLFDQDNHALGYQLVLDITAAMEAMPDTIYRHKWQEGDLLLWDNQYFIHNRTHLQISTDQERLMWRMNVVHDAARPVNVQ